VTLDEPFRRVSWDEALERVVNRTPSLDPRAGCLVYVRLRSDATEDYYVAQKLLKGCLGTNFDSNSRLCMSSAVAGYVQALVPMVPLLL